MSLNAIGRLAEHRGAAHWFTKITHVEIEQFQTREEALAAERTAILTEEPLHNLSLTPRYQRSREQRAEIKSVPVNIRITPEQRDVLISLAEKDKRSFSGMIVYLLERAIERCRELALTPAPLDVSPPVLGTPRLACVARQLDLFSQ